MKASDLPADAVATLPLGEDGPVFREPWQAQVFALVVKLAESGLFTWTEWTETFGAALAAARAKGTPVCPEDYFDHWLTALERLLTAKGVAAAGDLSDLKGRWANAYATTQHGKPVRLSADH